MVVGVVGVVAGSVVAGCVVVDRVVAGPVVGDRVVVGRLVDCCVAAVVVLPVVRSTVVVPEPLVATAAAVDDAADLPAGTAVSVVTDPSSEFGVPPGVKPEAV